MNEDRPLDYRDLPWSKIPTPDLLTVSRTVIDELRRRGVLRTSNAPAGDYAEYLALRHYGGELAPNSEKSWDLRAADGRRIQVKCRIMHRTGTALFSPFRSFEFDAALFVLLDGNDMSIVGAHELSPHEVRRSSTYRPHVNGWVVSAAKIRRAGQDLTVALKHTAMG